MGGSVQFIALENVVGLSIDPRDRKTGALLGPDNVSAAIFLLKEMDDLYCRFGYLTPAHTGLPNADQ